MHSDQWKLIKAYLFWLNNIFGLCDAHNTSEFARANWKQCAQTKVRLLLTKPAIFWEHKQHSFIRKFQSKIIGKAITLSILLHSNDERWETYSHILCCRHRCLRLRRRHLCGKWLFNKCDQTKWENKEVYSTIWMFRMNIHFGCLARHFAMVVKISIELNYHGISGIRFHCIDNSFRLSWAYGWWNPILFLSNFQLTKQWIALFQCAKYSWTHRVVFWCHFSWF